MLLWLAVNGISLGIPEGASIRSDRSRMLRETEGTPRGVSVSDSQRLKPNWRRKDTMEMINIHDVVLVLVLIAIAISPRAIVTYLAARK